MVMANVVDGQNEAIAPPYVIKTVNGVRIAIIGAVMGKAFRTGKSTEATRCNIRVFTTEPLCGFGLIVLSSRTADSRRFGDTVD
jgi:hypothetical protein